MATTPVPPAGFDRIIGFDMGGTSTDVTQWAGQYERAGRAYSTVLTRFPQSSKRIDALYGSAWSHYSRKEYTRAAELFDQVVRAAPAGKYAFDAAVRKGDALYGGKRFAEAAAAFRAVIATYPKNDGLDYVQFQLAEALVRAGDAEAGLKQYSEVRRKFPSSEYADDAAYGAAWNDIAASRRAGRADAHQPIASWIRT